MAEYEGRTGFVDAFDIWWDKQSESDRIALLDSDPVAILRLTFNAGVDTVYPEFVNMYDTVFAIFDRVGYTSDMAKSFPNEKTSINLMRYLEEHGFRNTV